MALTQKQHNFCTAYIKCGNQSEAYKIAYNADKMKDDTIYKRASELMQNGEITGLINSMRERTESKAIITLEQRKELLSRWVWEEETTNAMKAMDLLNKMEAVYIQKNQTEHSGEVGVKFEIVLDNSDDE